ncbi:hypothetical protein [Bordetella sp. 15P40C-2]|uniref:hypothetical protein n=1 Tax=Bordetella sp. 15P40C-2 TaxID=2572246 RepID=UPI001365EA45|nr:hypothetical protein [Bordetella sp. 15P40C-2]
MSAVLMRRKPQMSERDWLGRPHGGATLFLLHLNLPGLSRLLGLRSVALYQAYRRELPFYGRVIQYNNQFVFIHYY